MDSVYLPLGNGLFGCLHCGSTLSTLDLRDHSHDLGTSKKACAPQPPEPPPPPPRPRRKRTAAWEALIICRRFYPWRIPATRPNAAAAAA